ncbi:MAG: pyroglutamyl-peptidase I, partial [Bacillota bacterium]
KAGIPASLSYSAGTYVCNDLLYSILHHARIDGWKARVGFIHVPLLPVQAAAREGRIPSMSPDTVVRALGIILDTLACH